MRRLDATTVTGRQCCVDGIWNCAAYRATPVLRAAITSCYTLLHIWKPDVMFDLLMILFICFIADLAFESGKRSQRQHQQREQQLAQYRRDNGFPPYD
jgi:hypothetical protein